MAVDSQANTSATDTDIVMIDNLIDDNEPLSEAGCTWTATDYSCSYDAVFMAFFSIYRRSSLVWQECWRAESTINGFLVEQFNWIIEGFTSDLDFFALTARFSECRDNFRDWMYAVDAESFPRRGKVLASACRILIYFSDQYNRSEDLEHVRSCSNPACPPTINIRTFSFMCLPSIIEKFGDLRNMISVQSVVTQELAFLQGQPLTSKCNCCSGDHVRSTWSAAAHTWIWFEIYPNTRISPSLILTLNQFSEPQTFKLAAVVYHGAVHFTARWRDDSGVWWKHDGREHRGSPVVDEIHDESDLRRCDGRRMSFLIYSFKHDT